MENRSGIINLQCVVELFRETLRTGFSRFNLMSITIGDCHGSATIDEMRRHVIGKMHMSSAISAAGGSSIAANARGGRGSDGGGGRTAS